ncbi:MAG TPA: DinB family protein [Actinomycetota bacterium]|jgi:uncharacterized damage-inducible protein DinB
MQQDAIRHHLWATDNQLAACAELGEDQLATEVPGTYGTILDTLRHTIAADCSYLWVISGGRFGSTELDETTLDVAALRSTLAENAAGWEVLLAEGPVDDDRQVVRHRPDGSSTSAALGIRWAQVVHHSSDHRSQVNTALTALGLQPDEFDVWAYGESVGRVSETEPS